MTTYTLFFFEMINEKKNNEGLNKITGSIRKPKGTTLNLNSIQVYRIFTFLVTVHNSFWSFFFFVLFCGFF